MKSLPQLVQLQEQFGDQIHVITLSLDFDRQGNGPSAQLQADILTKLQQQEVDCDNIMSTTATHEVLESLGLSSLPAVLVYQTDGTQHEQFHGAIDFPNDVAPVIESLLTSPQETGP